MTVDEHTAALVRAIERLAAAEERKADYLFAMSAHVANIASTLASLTKKSIFEQVFGK